MTSRLAAAEILTSAWCPLGCRYCYIPKTKAMKDMHRQVITDLRSMKALQALQALAGSSIETLSFWGTEPALTLNLLANQADSLVEMLPKLKKISFSTSMVLSKPITKFVRAMAPFNLEFDIQVSLDGPEFITGENRFPGASKQVPENMLSFIKSINGLEFVGDVNLRWKATLTADNLRAMVSLPTRIDEYNSYFKQINGEIKAILTNKKIVMGYESYIPTLAVPGTYTSEDGKLFAEFLKLMHSKGYKTTYDARLKRIANFGDELQAKKAMFTCSGGDSNIGLSPRMHICHRSFYLDNPAYIDSVFEQDVDNWDISNFKRGNLDLLKQYFVVDAQDEYEVARFRYVLRGYHDFWHMQVSFITFLMKELALSNQSSERFLCDDAYTELFALFVSTGLSCPMEAILNTGCVHIVPVSLLRMFGNGAFEELLDELSRGKR